MRIARLTSADIHWREDGDPEGVPVVFANSLGTDLRLWDQVVARFPPDGYRLIRFDKRGHGLSSTPPNPYTLDALVQDTADLLDRLKISSCLFVGLSIGGMIGQRLALLQPQRIRRMVLSSTAAQMGTSGMWQNRISLIRSGGGLAAITAPVMERWFTSSFRETDACLGWQAMFERTPVEGYIGSCEAIAGADLRDAAGGITCPVLGLCGREDLASPPDLVRDTMARIPGARFEEIGAAGHLPCVEQPDAFTTHLLSFFKEELHD